jgi:glycerophosphoryl diester phosphodiesterase
MAKKALVYCIGIPVAVLAVLFLVVRIMGSPGAGKAAAERIGIPHPAVIAHRGASYLAPEETAPAYVIARDMGVDYLEMDIQRTRDGALVAVHDDTLERTTNVKDVFPGRQKDSIHSFTLKEIKKLDAGSWFNKQYPERARRGFAGLRILTLDEIITIASEGAQKPGLYIESKDPVKFPGIENDIVKLLDGRGVMESPAGAPPRVIFQSFDKNSLYRFKQRAPGIPRVYLIDQDMEKKSGWDALLQEASEAGSGVGPVGYLGWPWKTGAAHRRGLIVHIYTINVPWQFRLFCLFSADGFFTDRPDTLLAYYGRQLKSDPAESLKKYE